jgi:hypothetical protein
MRRALLRYTFSIISGNAPSIVHSGPASIRQISIMPPAVATEPVAKKAKVEYKHTREVCACSHMRVRSPLCAG